MKALKNYDLNNPTMSQADRIREDLNAENEGALSKNKYRRSVARKTDPAFAAQELAGNSLREGIYGQLENQGVKGARELRQDQGSLIKMRNAAEAQSFNGDKVVKGTGGASLAKKVGQTAFKAGGAVAGGTLGGALGGPAGEGVGALMGGQLGGELGSKVLNIPPDLSRDALVERSFGKKVAVGSPTEPEVNLRAAPATAPTGQQPLLTDPSTLFDLGQTGEEAFATPADITTAQQTREAPYQKILDDENASAAEKAQAKTEINKLRNSPIPQSMIRKSAPAGPSNPGADFLKENASAELARRSLPYQKILDSEDHTAAEKADAHLALADLHKEADKIITQAEKAAADKAKGTSKPASKPAAKPAAKAAEPPKAAPAETAASAGSAALRDTATADLEREIRIRDLQDIATGRAKPWGGIADRRQAQEILDSAYSGPERRAQARGSAALGGK